MTLTEEQRAAVEYAIKYIPNWPSTPKGCRARDVLRAMIDSSGTVEPTGGFDLEAARDLANNLIHCPETDEVFRKCVTEIERLRGFETAARDLSNDLTRVAKERDELQEANTNFAFQASDQAQEIERLRAENKIIADRAAHNTKQDAASAKLQAARIKELRAELASANVELMAAGETVRAKEARIKELEDALVDELVKQQFWCGVIPSMDERKMVARQRLQADGKIGPDADAKLHCWQITEEREEAFGRILRRLEYDQSLPGHTNYKIQRAMELLRAMLEEAGL